MFVDEAAFKIISGKGGDGAVAFRHEKYIDKGGPSGGDGGDGGSIVFVAKLNESTLLSLKYKRKVKADDGENGKIKNMTGATASNVIIPVPLGTMIFNADTNELIADLTAPDEERVILQGGRGGRGNANFATSRNKAPQYSEPGERSKEMNIRLELKVLADVGLVGYPSVGKSTIISVISECKPKIADYHFTTLQPNLGMVQVPDGRSFVCADLPGLIEGASMGIGLGFQFLKHIERTKVILHILDGSNINKNLINDYKTIRKELETYDLNLLEKGEIIVINKMDSELFEENKNEFIKDYIKEYNKEPDVVCISALEKRNLNELLYKTADLLEAEKEKIREIKPVENVVTYTFKEQTDYGFRVGKDYELLVYTVKGPRIDELLAGLNLDSDESVLRFSRALRKLGVEEALKKIGCIEGDLVKIGDIEFEFHE